MQNKPTTKAELLGIVNTNLESVINELFDEMHGLCETESGDIYPEQTIALSQLQTSLANLITAQVWQNMPESDTTEG